MNFQLMFILFFSLSTYSQNNMDIYGVCEKIKEDIYPNSKVIFLKDFRVGFSKESLIKEFPTKVKSDFEEIEFLGVPSIGDSIIAPTLLFYEYHAKLLDSIFQKKLSEYMRDNKIPSNEDMVTNHFKEWQAIFDSVKFSNYPFDVICSIIKIRSVSINSKGQILVIVAESSTYNILGNMAYRLILLEKRRKKMKVIDTLLCGGR
ncbi:MAG: hypothetical protein M9916_07385 [Crocinitomicaceae bacterium]|nr:hypothetical protein [Crocinitomicaceae bacterium]